MKIKKLLLGNIKGTIAMIAFLAAVQMVPAFIDRGGFSGLEEKIKGRVTEGVTWLRDRQPSGWTADTSGGDYLTLLQEAARKREESGVQRGYGSSDFPDFYIAPQRLTVEAEEAEEEPFDDFYIGGNR
ncbi:MAG: hypothetical protein JRC60_00320 [Deltaproteobacteria bacterium]|nr:hypothetical protein [Deltaproteobacteria bacterium]